MKQEVDRVIYQFWTGDNPLTLNRIKCLESSKNFGVKTILVTSQNLPQFIHPDYPIHQAYEYLSAVHRSDYLRCYFLHIHGGGYADIKFYDENNNWKQCFDLINHDDRIQIIGEKETDRATISWYAKCSYEEGIKRCIRTGFFIAKPYSQFTTQWFKLVNNVLDSNLERLRQHPSTHPLGGSRYPLRWAQLLGEIVVRQEYEFSMNDCNSVSQCLVSGRNREFQYR